MYGVILLLLHLSRDKEVHLIRSRSGCTKTVFLSGINHRGSSSGLTKYKYLKKKLNSQ